MGLFPLLSLFSTAHAAESFTPPAPDVTLEPALERSLDQFQIGERRVRTGNTLMVGGSMVGGVGLATAGFGILLGFAGNDSVSVPLLVGGGLGVLAGSGMVVASPFVMSSGLREQRHALADLGVEADRSHARTAVAFGVTGVALGLIYPPALVVGAASATALCLSQQQENRRALAMTVELSPEMYRDGGGLRVNGRF